MKSLTSLLLDRFALNPGAMWMTRAEEEMLARETGCSLSPLADRLFCGEPYEVVTDTRMPDRVARVYDLLKEVDPSMHDRERAAYAFVEVEKRLR